MQENLSLVDNLQFALVNKTGTLEDFKKKSAEAEVIRERIKSRKELQDKIDLNQKQLKYLTCKELQKTLKSKKRQLKEKEESLKSAKAERKEIDDSLSEYEKAKTRLQDEVDEHRQTIDKVKEFMRESPAIKIDEEIRNINKAIDFMLANKASQEKEKRGLQAKIESLERELSNFDHESLRRSKKEAQVQKSKVESEISQIDLPMAELENDLRATKMRINGSIRERNSLADADTLRLNGLKHQNVDAHEGTLWLREVVASGSKIFSKKVYEPPIVTVDFKYEFIGIYLQFLIKKQDLEAFICEDPTDCNTLETELRQKKELRINFAHSSSTNSYSVPNRKPDIRGFKFFMSEAFEAPPPVKAHLCNKFGLNKVPVFDENCDVDTVEREFTKYFIGNKMYTSRMGRYSNQRYTQIIDIRQSRQSCFAPASDEERIKDVDTRLDILKNDERIIYQELEKRKTQKQGLEGKLNGINQRLYDSSAKEVELKKKENDHRLFKDQLRVMEDVTADENERANLTDKRMNLTRKLAETTKLIDNQIELSENASSKIQMLKNEIYQLEVHT